MAFSGGSAGGIMAGQSPSPFAQFGRSPSPNPPANPFASAPSNPFANPFGTPASAPQQQPPQQQFGAPQSIPFGPPQQPGTSLARAASPFQQQQQNASNPSPFAGTPALTATQAFGSTGFGSTPFGGSTAGPTGFGSTSTAPTGFGSPANPVQENKSSSFATSAPATGFASTPPSSQDSPFNKPAISSASLDPTAQPGLANGSAQSFNPFGQPSAANSSQSSVSNPFSLGLGSTANNMGFGSRGTRGARAAASPVPESSQRKRGKKNESKPLVDKKPNFTEALAAKGTFVAQGDNGDFFVTKGKPSHANVKSGQEASGSRASLHNPFQVLSDTQASPAAAKAKQGHLARFTAAAPIATLEEFSTAVENQLKKDKVPELVLPPDFCDPRKRAQAVAFRAANLESHQNKVRESLERGGLIDIKDKQIHLKDAIDFRGTCEDMCPIYEVITRVAEHISQIEERAESPDGTPWPVREKFVKRHARSSAGDKSALPNEVRTIGALERTTNYLLDEVLQGEHNLRDRHAFLWDRFRAVRRDFTFQSRMLPDESLRMVAILETIARFHAISHHLLAKKGAANMEYSAQQEREAFQKTLISLKAAYGDLGRQGIQCKNEPEFLAYWIIFFAVDTSEIMRIEKDMARRNWENSSQVQTAVALAQARLDFRTGLREKDKNHLGKKYICFPSLALGEAATYFDIVADRSTSFTMACVAEMSFSMVRSKLLRTIVQACSRGRDSPKDITPAGLQEVLRFDTEEETVEFVKGRGLQFSDDGSYLVVSKNQMPNETSEPTFSNLLVERKRRNRPLLQVIRNNVYEDEAPLDTVGPRAPDDEESMFVDDFPASHKKTPAASASVESSAQPQKPSAPNQQSAKTNGLLGGFGRPSFSPALGPSQGNAAKPSPPPTGIPKPNPFAPKDNTASSGTVKPNPFTTKADNAPKANPFASISAGVSGSGGKATDPGQPSNASVAFPPAPASSSSATGFSVFQNKSPLASASPPSAGTQSMSIKVTPPTPQFPSPSFGKGLEASTPSIFGTAASSPQPASALKSASPGPPTGAPALQAASSGLASTTPCNSIFQNAAKAPGPALIQPQQAQAQATTQPGPSLIDRISAAKEKNGFTATGTTTGAAPATATPISFGTETAVSSSPKPDAVRQPAPLPQVSPPQPPTPADPMGQFTRWFVLGDGGMMEEFRDGLIEHIVRKTYLQFMADEEERKRKEEDAKSWEEALKWRRYNLGLKFFYRWRDIARDKALSRRAIQGREMMKAFRQSQLAQTKADREAAAAKAKADEARRAKQRDAKASNFVEDLRAMQQLKNSRRQSPMRAQEDALLATGVFDGFRDPEQAAADVIRDDDSVAEALLGPRSPSPGAVPEKGKPNLLRSWKDSLSRSASRVREGAMAVFSSSAREPRHGAMEREDGGSHTPPSRTSSLSRSLPPKDRTTNFSAVARKRTASPGADALDRLKRPRSAGLKTSHFRLRSMGMIRMPNGQYLHESIAKPMLEGRRFPGIGDYGLPPVADGEVTDEAHSPGQTRYHGPSPEPNQRWRSHAPRLSSTSSRLSITQKLDQEEGTPPHHKRKRPAAEQDHDVNDAMQGDSTEQRQSAGTVSPSSAKKQRTSKVDVAETERIIQEMRETAALMEEGETWYREQSELLGRGQSPWA